MQMQNAAQDFGLSSETSERRTQNRIDVELVVTIESDSNFFSGFSENISEGGLFISTYDYKPRGTVFELVFQLPDLDKKILTRCEVCWIREYNPSVPDMVPGMGVRFLDLDKEAQDSVLRFCQQLREPMFIDLDL